MKKIINFIKKNKLFIITIILIFIVFNIKLPYYIEAPGGLININDRYEIENSYDIKGSLNMTYVSEYRANIPFYLIAKINSNYDIIKKDEIVSSNESEKDSDYRGYLMLKESNDNALVLAYKKANKEYKINNQKIYVTYIDKKAKTDIKIKDQIISIDNIKVDSKEDIYKITKSKNINDKLNIKVLNDNKEYNRYAYILDNNIIGILITYERDITTYPKLKINYKKREYGSSGGLMISLAIYNKLVSNDITKGYKIAGTGTIDEYGNVGEIDGIKYKLKGAVNNKADIFLVPSGDNYKEAIKEQKKHKYKIKIVEVKTFDDAINYLNTI